MVLANVCRSTVNQVLARDRASQQQPTLDLPTASVVPETSNQPATAQSEMADAPGVVVTTAEAPAAALEMSSTSEGVNPLDRSADRVMARMGLMEDAQPVLASGENLPWVGVFLALALVGQEPLLPVAQKCFGSLGAAFYGLRTTLVNDVVAGLAAHQTA